MGIVLLAARLLLAVVFAVAGLTKLADRAGSRQALIDFGVPARLASPGDVLLPVAELAVALALIPNVSSWWAAIGALVLLLLFIAGISFNLAQGRTPDCHCFGQLHSAPAGWPTLLRNVFLAAVAGLVITSGRAANETTMSWLGTLGMIQWIGLIIAAIVVALVLLEGWFLWQVLRQQGRLLLRIETLEAQLASKDNTEKKRKALTDAGLPAGTPAPAFQLPDIQGALLTLDDLRAGGKQLLLVFSDPDCGPCRALVPEVDLWQRTHGSTLAVALISRGTPGTNRARYGKHAITHVLLQKDREVAELYRTVGTPSAVLVSPEGVINSPLAQGADEIRALVAGAVGLPALRSAPESARIPSQSAS